MKQLSADQFVTLTSTGAILPPDLLAKVAKRNKDIPGLTLKAYKLTPGETINEAISRSWNRLTGIWQNFQEAIEEKGIDPYDPATGFTRERWLHPLFQELGYGNLDVVHSLQAGEKAYPISHVYRHSPIHLLGINVDIDKRSEGVTGAATQIPHSLVQEFLNRSDDFLWGIVSNGYRIRLLRDNVTLTRQAYVEFDLKAMMESDSYADFTLLWLVCHSSRVDAKQPEQCWLEKWSKLSAKEGTRALNDLRNGVINAIRNLGTGFLDYPSNTELLSKLRDADHPNHLNTQDFYRQLLRIVYRLLFLFVAEDRELLLHPDADPDSKKLYKEYYSTRRLRELAENKRGSRHPDIWRAVQLVFNKLGEPEGCPQLGLPALGSFLWAKDAVEDLINCDISNNSFLKAIRNLCFIRQDDVTRRIDYRNLGSEELGSIYESLLELQPEINTRTAKFELNILSGNERKTTGSYYTPTSLINELLNSALEPVIDRAVKDRHNLNETTAFKDDPPKARAILNLKICDPATGSGHFLIAAAHRMAKRVAAARTDEEEPSPESYRTALRDVIGHCIYGVDINPMAVELCKVSLWLEALEPKKPLNFLDHHIKCGNSLLGTTPELISKGIPIEAFPTKSNLITGDDPKVASSLRKQNKEERKGQLSLDLFSKQDVSTSVQDIGRQIAELDSMDDSKLEAVTKKSRKYEEIAHSKSYTHQKLIADAWCAAFMWPKKEGMPPPVTQGLFQKLEKNPDSVPTETITEIKRLTQKYKFFNWHVEYPEVFTEEEPGFDIVLGNPPFVNAIEGGISKRIKYILYHINQHEISGTSDYAYYFLNLANHITEYKGLIALIQPKALLDSNSISNLRKRLMSERPPIFIHSPPSVSLFSGASAYICIVILGHETNCKVSIDSVDDSSQWKSGHISSDNWWKSIQFILGESDPMKHIESFRLKDHFHVQSSMTTGDAYKIKPYLVDREQGNEPKLLTTGLIDPFTSYWGEKEARYLGLVMIHPRVLIANEFPNALKRKLNRSKNPKVLIAGLSNRIEAFYDDIGQYVGAVSTYTIYETKASNNTLYTLCEWLNSNKVSEWIRLEQGGSSLGGDYFTLKKSVLLELPVPVTLIE